MPDVHQQQGDPSIDRRTGVIVGDAQAGDRRAQQADVRPGEDLPDHAHHVPRNQERHRQNDEKDRSLPASSRNGAGNPDAEGNLQNQHQGAEAKLPQQGVLKPWVAQRLPIPIQADEDAGFHIKDVLHRVVHHRHKGRHGAERHHQHHRRHGQPG